QVIENSEKQDNVETIEPQLGDVEDREVGEVLNLRTQDPAGHLEAGVPGWSDLRDQIGCINLGRPSPFRLEREEAIETADVQDSLALEIQIVQGGHDRLMTYIIRRPGSRCDDAVTQLDGVNPKMLGNLIKNLFAS